MTQAQQWLDNKYNNKQSGDSIKLLTSEELSGEIKIEGYTNVKEINLVRLEKSSLSKGKITKVTINNCPALKTVILGENEITAIVFEGNFPNLTQLEVQGNQLKEVELSKLLNLEFLNIARNPIDSQKIGESLKSLTKTKFINLLGTSGFSLKDMAKDDHAGWINPNDIKNALGVSPNDPLPGDWKNKLDDLKKRLTQEDLNKAVKNAEDKAENKYKDYIDPKNSADKTKLEKAAKDAGFISPNDLEKEAKNKGMVSKADYDKIKQERDNRPNTTLSDYQKLLGNQEKHTDYDTIKNELERWRKLGQNPEKVAQDIKDLQSRPATGGSGISSAEQYDYLVVRAYLSKKEGNNWRKNVDEWKKKPINVSYIENSKQYFAQVEQQPK
jgi:hypothetical protein